MRLVLVLSVALPIAAAAGAPRPLSPAEAAATRLAHEYLTSGHIAEARLADTSPLRMKPAVLARSLGPAAGARWELLTASDDRHAVFSITNPAGDEELVTLEFTQQNGEARLVDVRSSMSAAADELIPQQRTAGARTARPASFAKERWPILPWVIALIGIAAVFVLWRSARVLAICAGAVTALWVVPIVLHYASSFTAPATLVSATPAAWPQADSATAVIEAARAAVRRFDAPSALRALSRFPDPSRVLAVEVLRARAARLALDYQSALAAYDRAIALTPAPDGLLLEAAEAAFDLGVESKGMAFLERATALGSRDARVYYALAEQTFIRSEIEQAEKYLQVAWRLEPLPRRELLRRNFLAPVAMRPALAKVIDLRTATPRYAEWIAIEGDSWVKLDGLHAQGETLHLYSEHHDAHLRVPGGIAVWKEETKATPPELWLALEHARAFKDFEGLRDAAQQRAAARVLPISRMQRMADVLYARKRWDDLAAITEALDPASDVVPLDLIVMRYHSLVRVQRNEDAAKFLSAVARNPSTRLRRNPDALATLADLFADARDYDVAESLLELAIKAHPAPYLLHRLEQVRTDSKLQTAYAVMKTDRFEFRFPARSLQPFIEPIARRFDDEFTRLRKWFPNTRFEPIVVNVVSKYEFRTTYAGTDAILGMYRGTILVPFAGVHELTAQMRETIAHELFHAMLAQATGDQAPRWMQEGFAQFIEPKLYAPNAFAAIPEEHHLAFDLLDEGLSTWADLDITQASYLQAETLIRFIHARKGDEGLLRLIDEVSSEKSSLDAVNDVLGSNLPSLEERLAAWGRYQRPWFSTEH